MTQNQKILQALRKGRVLTMLDIFKLCGSMNGHKRIMEILLTLEGGMNFIWVKRGKRKVRAWKLA